MRYFHRAYTIADFIPIREFLVDVYLATQCPQSWDFTRWEMWTYTHHDTRKGNEAFFAEKCHLWFDDQGNIVGVFISDHGREDFNLIPRPKTSEILPQMLQWILDVWGKERPTIRCSLYKSDEVLTALFQQAGFVNQGLESYTWKYDLTQGLVPPYLEPGYQVASIKEIPDRVQRCEVVSAAYNGNTTGFTQEEYDWRCSAPGYSADFDLSCISPEGIYLSCCTGWLDLWSRTAVVETVGTRPTERQKGLAKAVISACFQRLANAGAESAFITSFHHAAHRTYHSLQPTQRYDAYCYVLEQSDRNR